MSERNERKGMLVLTRKKGESVQIGDDICVTIVESSGGRVRIGIEAPRSVAVHRQEVYFSSQSGSLDEEGIWNGSFSGSRESTPSNTSLN